MTFTREPMVSLPDARTRDDVMEVCQMAVVFAALIRTSGRAAV
jgi:hypothetical protein